jgi:putative acetyltransferase
VTFVVRVEAPADVAAIRAVHESAFPTGQEADLVDSLRVDGDLVLSLVAVKDGGIAGHVAFSRMMVKNSTKDYPEIALAPIGVTPDLQRRGIGSVLIESGLRQLAEGGEALVFVVGAPDYYGRFGFSAALASGFSSPYAGRYFQLKRLKDHAPVSGSVHYASAFSKLS